MRWMNSTVNLFHGTWGRRLTEMMSQTDVFQHSISHSWYWLLSLQVTVPARGKHLHIIQLPWLFSFLGNFFKTCNTYTDCTSTRHSGESSAWSRYIHGTWMTICDSIIPSSFPPSLGFWGLFGQRQYDWQGRWQQLQRWQSRQYRQ